MPNFRYLRENPNNPYRLGRHQVHDVLDALPERKLENVVDLLKPIKSVAHTETQPVFDQGNLGSCTANAALGTLVTMPFAKPGRTFTEDDAVALYELETKLDDSQIPGEYPPDDTGSTGPWSMMALEKQGLITGFRHTRTLHVALVALNDGPISFGGIWYQSMFTPGSGAVLTVDPGSGEAGGHQYAMTANDVDRRRVKIRNSWDLDWGDEGHAWMDWNDLDFLLDQGGDVVQPVL